MTEDRTIVTAAEIWARPAVLQRQGSQQSDHPGSGRSAGAKGGISGCGPTRDCVCKPDLCRAWKTSHFLRAWKKQEGICGEERHLDGDSRVFGAVALALERVRILQMSGENAALRIGETLGLPAQPSGAWDASNRPFSVSSVRHCAASIKRK